VNTKKDTAECVAKRNVIQPKLLFVVCPGDAVCRNRKEKPRSCHHVHERTFGLSYRVTEQCMIKVARRFQISNTKNNMIYREPLQ
jgi:hypothetical protein